MSSLNMSPTNRVKWKTKFLGDHAFITFSYNSNLDIRVIPRAKGVRIRSTKELGGGYLSISISGVKAESDRADLEEYFQDLDTNFELNEKGDLTIYNIDGSTAYILTDCYLQSFDQEENDLKINSFSAKFVKSL